MAKELHIGICVPSGLTWMARFGHCLSLMTTFFMTTPLGGYKSRKYTLYTLQCSMLCQSRENLVKRALQDGVDYILFLDSDMEFPPETLHRLLLMKKDFICAGYSTRSEPALPVAVGLDGKKIDSKGKTGIEKIQHAGFGVCLIKATAFKKLRPPLFMMDWIPQLGSYCGEDVYFAMKMAEIGIPLYIDHDLSQRVGHIGGKIYTFNDIDDDKLADYNARCK